MQCCCSSLFSIEIVGKMPDEHGMYPVFYVMISSGNVSGFLCNDSRDVIQFRITLKSMHIFYVRLTPFVYLIDADFTTKAPRCSTKLYE